MKRKNTPHKISFIKTFTSDRLKLLLNDTQTFATSSHVQNFVNSHHAANDTWNYTKTKYYVLELTEMSWFEGPWNEYREIKNTMLEQVETLP